MEAAVRQRWPDGRAFAFTIFDDTDRAEVESVGPVYALLRDLGLRTTKSVWAIRGDGTPRIGGATCEDRDYLAWTLELQAAGFEIASHGAAPATSARATVRRALDRFRELFGGDPVTLANHSGGLESIYWGDARVSGSTRVAYNLMTRFRNRDRFRGHVDGDSLFWGDLCRERVTYVRNFTFNDVNTLNACPEMPYRDPERPYVRAWFASSEGANVASFNERLSEAQQDRLEAEGGACIMYTHFASGFWDGSSVDRRFRELMIRLASRGGWFVPVGELLAHLEGDRGPREIEPGARAAMERRWLFSKLRVGHT